ncbi:MAG: hypothetical protein KatS3mg109_1479 [Pirellulaceae bacterium]|nr:MAG: hypothetical protein KatS3mg109_1479 [Pirellulaceae bacterium]GIW93781.1 MAG: hypothetical protein KatS3mg110_1822 [Pirellulaceae bacterium]
MPVRWMQPLGGLAIAAVTEAWMGTLDFRAVFYDPTVDPAGKEFSGPAIYLFWHEYIPFLFYLRGHCRIAMLLSRHRDAEWLAHAARFRGFSTIRGSTRRGGAQAVLECLRQGTTTNLAITPDGPRGPRRHMAAGPVFLASRLGLPLVPIGLGYENPWRLSTWDRFAIPRPASRARGVVGPRIVVPADAERAELEAYRLYVEKVLNQLTQHAERWAISPACHPDERIIQKAATHWRPPKGGTLGHQQTDPPAHRIEPGSIPVPKSRSA